MPIRFDHKPGLVVYLTAGDRQIIATLSGETTARDGEPLEVVIDLDKTHLFDPETEKALY